MKFYVAVNKKTLYAFIALLLAVIFILSQLVAEKAGRIDGSTHRKRMEFLKSQGVLVEENTFTSKEVIIPSEFSGIYKKYNNVQKESGFNLTAYKGKTVTLYSYAFAQSKRVNLLVYKGEIIGGDIYELKAEGEIYPLK